VASNIAQLRRSVAEARQSIHAALSKRLDGRNGAFYAPDPLGHDGRVAFVFPGFGCHYAGMGRDLSAAWSEVLRSLDDERQRLASHFLPMWQDDAELDAVAVHRLIIGQVAHGVAVSDLLQRLGIRPHAVIGYSLGESTGLFAMRAWRDREHMFARLAGSPLFQTELAGPCNAAPRGGGVAPRGGGGLAARGRACARRAGRGGPPGVTP